MRVLVTGGAGFIGSHLIDRLLTKNHEVFCVDNLLLGKKRNLINALKNERFKLFVFDILEMEKLDALFLEGEFDVIYHLAANSDIKLGFENLKLDYNNTLLTTYNILRCMKKYGNKKILFASSSAIYGNNSNNLNESTGPLLPISNYGAAKLASEAFISSFCASNDLKALIIRFPNVVGYRLTHGVIYDFIEKLKSNSTQLLILGNGKQQKPYLYIDDLLNAIDLTLNSINNKVTIYNVAPNSLTTVKFIADIVINVMKLNEVELQYTGGDIGWIGDVPTFSYDTTKINHLGWSPNFTSNEAVIKSIEEEIQYRESHYYSS